MYELITRLSRKFKLIGVSRRLDSNIGNIEFRFVPNIPKIGILYYELVPFFMRGKFDIFWGTNHVIPHTIIKNPTVVTIHDLIPYKYPSDDSLSSLQRLRVYSSINRASRIVCVSETTANDVLDIFGRKLEKKISVIKPGVSVISRELLYKLKESFRPIVRRLESSVFFLVPGAHRPRKNLPLAVSAFELLKLRSKEDIYLVITGELHTDYKSLIKGKEYIITTGPLDREEVLYLMSKSIAVLYPSLYEGFGSPKLEAMALGVPVLALDIQINREIGGEGIILLKDNPEEWAEVMHV
ncbi:MAG: glycosyltransferase family 4 protein, partial [Candidatus Calescibacterium sp.]|nr:glycosyltransferase family 4 protein [Candidatus Calescibacterium sp.]